ncbi:hypothetical protein C2W62_08570 [Candidatus Entotheonella serta]|nr:hypothetical protein C2W62_08570 [Candidatus Entotheonella serta]
MTLKRRLQLAFALIFGFTIGIGSLAIWSVQRWEETTHVLNHVHLQSLRVERLRGDIHRQAKELSDWLTGEDADAPEEYRHLETVVQAGLASLVADVRRERERRSVEDLSATYSQLQALASAIFTSSSNLDRKHDIHRIEHEVETQLFPALEHDIEALRAYYQSDTARALAGTIAVGRLTRITAVGIAALSLFQVGFLFWGIQRWFVKPLAQIRGLTDVISQGNFDQRIDLHRRDEMGQLATDIEGMAEKLYQSQTRLIQSERLMALGELTSYIAHNMRNPLASIRAAAQVGSSDAPEKQEVWQDIMVTVDRLEGWVRSLLVYLKPVRLALAIHDPNRLIRDILALLELQIQVRELRPVLQLTPVQPVEMDITWMEQALVTVVTNAIEASPEGACLFIASVPTNGGVCVSIRDEGKGVSPDVLDKLFTPYFTTKPNGVGLGLAMAKKVLAAHGGAIDLHSDHGVGTTVTIHLPRRVVVDGNNSNY